MAKNSGKEDTIHLLKECDAGTKMAVASIDEVLDKVEMAELHQILSKSRQQHEALGNELHTCLKKQGEEEKEPNPVARGMSWIKTNMKITMDESDKTIADLMTDGCDMGVKSLYRYQHQYPKAEACAQNLCGRLIEAEEGLRKELQPYL